MVWLVLEYSPQSLLLPQTHGPRLGQDVVVDHDQTAPFESGNVVPRDGGRVQIGPVVEDPAEEVHVRATYRLLSVDEVVFSEVDATVEVIGDLSGGIVSKYRPEILDREVQVGECRR